MDFGTPRIQKVLAINAACEDGGFGAMHPDPGSQPKLNASDVLMLNSAPSSSQARTLLDQLREEHARTEGNSEESTGVTLTLIAA